MNIRRSSIFTVCIAGCLAAVVVFWQWNDYTRQRRDLERLLVVRGHAVLSALEGGIRSHRRMGMWLQDNLSAILEETVKAPGILGLAVIDKGGNHMTSGGDVPIGLLPSPTPQWTKSGLVMFRKVEFVPDIPIDDRMNPPDRGGMMMRGRPRQEGAFPGDDRMDRPGRGGMMMRGRLRPEGILSGKPLNDPAWLEVLLDDSEYQDSLSGARRRFAVSLTITLASLVLGVALVTMVQRQGRLEAELELANEQQARLEQLSLLGAGLAHETKNPLSVIRGLAQSWANHPDTPAQAKTDAQKIIDEADRVVGRVNSFLTYSRPKQPEPDIVDLAKIVEETALLFDDDASAGGITISVHTDAARVWADEDMVRQVLVNLISNALSACDRGDSISVGLDVATDTGTVSMTVADTGSGMQDEDLAQAVKPYYTRRSDGTGLGLAIVDQIVKSHGWRMSIESIPNEGTSVRIEGMEQAKPV